MKKMNRWWVFGLLAFTSFSGAFFAMPPMAAHADDQEQIAKDNAQIARNNRLIESKQRQIVAKTKVIKALKVSAAAKGFQCGYDLGKWKAVSECADAHSMDQEVKANQAELEALQAEIQALQDENSALQADLHALTNQ